MEFRPGNNETDSPDVDIDLRMGVHQRDHPIGERISCMHHIKAQLRVPDQNVLQQQGIAGAGAKLRRAEVSDPRRTGAEMDGDRDVELFGQHVVRSQLRAIRPFSARLDHACLIIDGLVGRFGQNADGARQITALHIPGDMADLHSVVLPKVTSAIQALSTATILRVPQTAIRTAARRYPAIAEALWRDCMVDAAILSQWVVNVGRRDARTRMAHLLCEMATRYKATFEAEEVTFELRLTQAHLADATGLTTVHVNRTLKALRDGGLATLCNRAVTILDWDALASLGEFDDTYLQVDIKPEERLRILEAV